VFRSLNAADLLLARRMGFGRIFLKPSVSTSL